MNINCFQRLNKPEYFFRPTQLLFRVMKRTTPSPGTMAPYRLPWGVDISVRGDDMIGHSLRHLGVYDLVVSEALWRLAEPGDCAVDVGANVGYMTSILAVRVGAAGRVVSFEPHPQLFRQLADNIERWKRCGRIATVQPIESAVSSREGTGLLCIPECFAENSGVSFLVRRIGAVAAQSETVNVRVLRLDSLFATETAPLIIKLDVEGHELSALAGCKRLLRSRKVRDIIFEEHRTYPTPVTAFLESAGYRIWRLRKTLAGPVLADPSGTETRMRVWEARSYLASLDASRAERRFRPRGWKALSARRHTRTIAY